MLGLIGHVKGKRVLDAGCGYGYYSILLARSGARVTGIDISERMIELAKNNAREASVKCQFFVCDVQNLSMFSKNTFDMVVSSVVVGDLDFLEKAFSEVYRVLKRNGTFAFSENHPLLKGSWEKVSGGKRLHWNIDNYFVRSVRTTQWKTQNGRIIETSSRHRTVQDYFDALTTSGFLVERLVEPEPTDKTPLDNLASTEHYSRAKRIPIFILFKARKPA
jgi:ubiquinone/menaquinone biosynthesis C-methylase UbiE